MTLEPSLDPDLEVAKLRKEQSEIMAEQASGKWDEPNVDPTWLQARVRRGIEIASILRRTNTGPSKPKASKKKPAVDIEAVEASLLE